jgi:hypothetical protein
MVPPEWVLALMLKAQPAHPYRATYERTSEAIARASEASPLFSGDRGDAKTAALLVSLAFFESGMKPDAAGDCSDKTGQKRLACTEPGAIPHSFCLLQIHESNLAGFGVTREEIQSDVGACVRTSLALLHQSFRICRALGLEDQVRWYAGGGPTCPTSEDATRKSRHRVLKGRWLFDALPPAW